MSAVLSGVLGVHQTFWDECGFGSHASNVTLNVRLTGFEIYHFYVFRKYLLRKNWLMKKLVSLKSRSLILSAFQTSACNEQKGYKCLLFNVVNTDSGSSFCVDCYEHVGQCCIRDLIDPAPQVLNCGCSGFALMHSTACLYRVYITKFCLLRTVHL
jgi:hypothetical protein